MKLSFIVPVYNVAPYLRKCVDSLLAQDYEDYEIILVDDGSTDESAAICDEYTSHSLLNSLTHSVIIKVLHQKNSGLSAARNAGAAIALGEYICFVDSDDFWQPDVLGTLMQQVHTDHLDVLRFKHQYVHEDGTPYNPYKSNPYAGHDYSADVTDGVTFLNTRFGISCYAWAFILRRELLEGCAFIPGIYFEDTDWTPRMLAKAKRVASADIIVYNYLLTRQGSITNAVNRNKQKKVLDDKMRLIGEMQLQAERLRSQGYCNAWYYRMIAATVISIIGMLSTDFYGEKKAYLSQLRQYRIFPIHNCSAKARLINLSPRLAIEMLHLKNTNRS